MSVRAPLVENFAPAAFAAMPLMRGEAEALGAWLGEGEGHCLARRGKANYFHYRQTGAEFLRRRLFIKCVDAFHADRLRRGEAQARLLGATVIVLALEEREWPENGHSAFVYDWIDGRPPNAGDAETLGRALGVFHAVASRHVAGKAIAEATAARDAAIGAMARRGLPACEADAFENALLRLHENAICCHGDLNLGNVLVDDSENSARLVDFEEFPHSAYTPWLDFTRLAERLVLVNTALEPRAAETALSRLMRSYRAAWPDAPGYEPGMMKRCGEWNALLACALISDSANWQQNAALVKEEAKFRRLLALYSNAALLGRFDEVLLEAQRVFRRAQEAA